MDARSTVPTKGLTRAVRAAGLASEVIATLRQEQERTRAVQDCIDRSEAWLEKPGAFRGEAIRERSEELGLDQSDVGALLGLDPSWVSKLERGKAQPSLSTFLALAFILQIPISSMVVFPMCESTTLDPSVLANDQ